MSSSIGQSVADEVRAHMARQRKTQAEMAKAIGISQVTVSRRLSGEVPFDVAQLQAVAEFLGVPLLALLPEPVAS